MDIPVVKLHLATLVSPWLGGRYRKQGDFSGEEFRDAILLRALAFAVGDVEVDLDGIEGPSPGFLDEALGAGLVETVGAEQAARVVVVGVKNAHLVKMIMEYRAETIAGER